MNKVVRQAIATIAVTGAMLGGVLILPASAATVQTPCSVASFGFLD